MATAVTAPPVLDLLALSGGKIKGRAARRAGAAALRVPDWLDTPLDSRDAPDQRPAIPPNAVVAVAAAVCLAVPTLPPALPPPPYAHGSIELLTGPMFSGKSTALLARVAALAAEGRRVVVVKPRGDTRYAKHWAVSHAGRGARCHVVDTLRELREMIGEEAWRGLDAVAVDEAQFFGDLVEFALEASEGGLEGGAGTGGGVDNDRGSDDTNMEEEEEAKKTGVSAAAAALDAAAALPPCRPKLVVVAGLSGDFRRRPFGRVGELLPLCDRVSALRAQCWACGAPAPFSLRLPSAAAAGAALAAAPKAEEAAAAGAPLPPPRQDEQVLVGGGEAYQPACRACFVRHTAAAAAAASAPADARLI
jgi:thymidine kinase